MKSGKAVGPDDIPVEVWTCLGEAAVEFLTSLFNRVLKSERMPEEWRRSVLVPIFKNKGDVQSCSNYRGIKLMSHTMKLWERVVEARLRKVVDICEQQYGFMPRKSTTDAIFALRILMEKYRDGQRELHCVFVDLEKAYDRVPREELWYCMRKSGVAEKYVRVVQDMYERSRTVVRCAVGQTEEFKVEVGLHQGSALSPFLFAIVMDQLSEEVRQESPWTMMFADDIVICSESREQVEENLERWRFALERRGMKVSHSKTEYMCVNEREGSGTVRLQGEEVKKVQEFKYLGSTVQSNGECAKEVKKRVQAGWNGWRKVSGVLCDRKISARIKGKVYRTVVRPAMLYGLETVSLRKRQESELEVAELKMLRFSLGVTRLDRIRNEYIRGTAHVGCLGDKVREARLRWFGHVQRRERVMEDLDPEEQFLRDARNGNLAGIQRLLMSKIKEEAIFNINCKGKSRSNFGWTPLHLSCYFGHRDVVEELLKYQFILRMTDFEPFLFQTSGQVTVMLVEGNEVVKLLLQYDACPSDINGSAQIPKDITHDEEIRSMLEAAERTEERKLEEQVLEAAREGATTTLLKLLTKEKPPNINCTDLLGNTPLHCAAYRGQKQCAVKLLQNGASPNIKNKNGQTVFDLVKDAEMRQILEGSLMKSEGIG
ncbi:hypothetical protein QTP86_012617 [Hemibagrus guttatus]|nr:hypothetical protein QTP86_012617 [Hemibagrus guttatus]